MLDIVLTRKPSTGRYTLGTLDAKGVLFPTIEDVERDTDNNGRIDNGEVKVWGETAIPRGRYRVILSQKSPKFSQYEFYRKVCDGKLPRLLDVPNFDGVLIHCGRTEKNSAGCILLNTYGGTLDRSRDYFRQLYDILSEEEGEIWLTIR